MYSIELQTVFYEYQNKNHKIKTKFCQTGLRPLAADKTGFNLKFFHFDIRGKLSIIRCDKYILQVVDHEKEWKNWCDSETPEEERLPCGYGDSCGTYR